MVMTMVHTMEEATPETLIAEFIGDIALVIKKHWPLIAEKAGFASAHMIVGALEQMKQKILEDLNEELLKAGFEMEEVH